MHHCRIVLMWMQISFQFLMNHPFKHPTSERVQPSITQMTG